MLRKKWLLRTLILAGIVVVLCVFVSATFSFFRNSVGRYHFGVVRNFIFTPEGAIESIEDRTNVLILGKDGQGQEASALTDVMIFVSISHSKPNVTMISLPRDIWLFDLKTKLDNVYYWGNKSRQGAGLDLAKASVEEIVGQPIQYGVVVDFDGFVGFIDALGGIDIDVERAFVDEKYPIPGKENENCGSDEDLKCRYKKVEFAKGMQKMDGEKTLEYVRSGNAAGDGEGDFASQERQQQVLSAVYQKLLSRDVLTSYSKLKVIEKIVRNNVESDISSEQAAILARRLLQARNNIESFTLPQELLESHSPSPEYDSLYVFLPKGENWKKVHEWISSVLNR
jgi:LCP family protein required for cell wall assembly